jgi:parvulin-like peptidyl-prolyl isomerase
MNRVVLSMLAAACCIHWAAAQAPNLKQLDVVQRSVPAGPVAMINGHPVSRENFLALYEQQLAAVDLLTPGDVISDEDRVRTGLKCLRELLQRQILLDEAARQGIKVGPEEIEKAWKEEMTLIRRAAERQGLAQLSDNELLQRGGKTVDQARRELQEALLVDKISDKIAENAGATVKDSDIAQFYKDNARLFQRPGGAHLKQIFVYPRPDARSASETAWDDAKRRIEQALQRIRAGEQFDAVAKTVAESTQGKPQIDLGVVPVEQLPPFYREAIGKMKPGELSGIIRSEHGYHLIQLIALESAGTISLEQATPRIKAVLQRQKSEAAVQDFCEPLLAKANVMIFLDLEKNLSAALVEAARGKK